MSDISLDFNPKHIQDYRTYIGRCTFGVKQWCLQFGLETELEAFVVLSVQQNVQTHKIDIK